MNKQIYTNIFSFDLEFFRQNKISKWTVLTYLHSYDRVYCVCISFSIMLSRTVCIPFSDNTLGSTSPPGKSVMQYSSMASKSLVSKTSFPSARFELSAGLETNFSYSCRAWVYSVRSKI